MVANLPSNIKVGVINVSVAGCDIALYDKNNYQTYVSSGLASWMLDIKNGYDGNPYKYLVDIAKLAPERWCHQGHTLHQGETNTGDETWPAKVKGL